MPQRDNRRTKSRKRHGTRPTTRAAAASDAAKATAKRTLRNGQSDQPQAVAPMRPTTRRPPERLRLVERRGNPAECAATPIAATLKRHGSSKIPSSPRQAAPKGSARRYWSADVMQHSNALDLERGVFQLTSPRRIAASLKRSSERSTRRKGSAYQSAMSMLNFYINRAGKQLSRDRKRILERTKSELRRVFGRPPARSTARRRSGKRAS
ncbi:MAG TPA: DUF3175 domain-containing protein [Nitrospira sp.]|nr:DUF3175 domain-containing protein [Nitrospira sp.]